MDWTFWDWLLNTGAGLAVRIAVGVSVLVALAIWDLKRKGPNARRWREYLFLLAAVGAAMAYGAINDQITVTISWRYFHLHDEATFQRLGPGRPDDLVIRWEAFKIGLQATWTAGLIMGVLVLLANNPRKNRPQLPDRSLYRLLPIPLILAASTGAILGAAFWWCAQAGLLGNWLNKDDFPQFMCVYGVHLGGYVGAAAGAVLAVWKVLRWRRKLAAGSEQQR